GFLVFLGIFFAKPSSWVDIVSGLFKFGTVPVSGSSTENIFIELFQRGRFPAVDLSLIAMIAALAAIAGNGGLTNTPISNFTRDQLVVWMGACLIGVSLPSILSVEFLPRGTNASDWTMAAMTAGGVQQQGKDPRPGLRG